MAPAAVDQNLSAFAPEHCGLGCRPWLAGDTDLSPSSRRDQTPDGVLPEVRGQCWKERGPPLMEWQQRPLSWMAMSWGHVLSAVSRPETSEPRTHSTSRRRAPTQHPTAVAAPGHCIACPEGDDDVDFF